MEHGSIQRKFSEALDALVEQVKEDRSMLVTIDDKKVEGGERALYADGVNVHTLLMPRAEFRKTVEGTVRISFTRAFLAKGRLLYTHDPTIADLCAGLGEIGERFRRTRTTRMSDTNGAR